jgi:hypothetical protein
MPEPVCACLLEKLGEQIERTTHLIALVPAAGLDGPGEHGEWTVGVLLGHLLECCAGFCAVLAAAGAGAQFEELRGLPVNHRCEVAEALRRIEDYRTHIVAGFEALSDADLTRRVPTVFGEGQTVLGLLLGNWEHLVNHKHELFTRLKGMGVEVGTRDLYRFRG